MTGSPDRGREVEQRDRKAALRSSVRDARRALSPAERQHGSAAISSRLRLVPEFLTVGVVVVYAAAETEVDVEAAAADLRRRGARTLYPKVRGEDLDLVPVADVTHLVSGYRGILEPVGDATDPWSRVDAVVVPGVAFDLRGRRLGQGGGHYDRLLSRLDNALRVGVAFTCQVVPQVPHEAHDVAMDLLVTDRVVHRFERRDAGA